MVTLEIFSVILFDDDDHEDDDDDYDDDDDDDDDDIWRQADFVPLQEQIHRVHISWAFMQKWN